MTPAGPAVRGTAEALAGDAGLLRVTRGRTSCRHFPAHLPDLCPAPASAHSQGGTGPFACHRPRRVAQVLRQPARAAPIMSNLPSLG
jgi:hypothetical protein